MKKSTCVKCGRQFEMGLNGICDPDRCDDCAGIQRDDNGYAWEPDEQEHHYQHVGTGQHSTVSRKDAFKHGR